MGVRFSLKTVLRDCVIMLCGTVLGILLAQGFFNTNNKVKIISHLTKREHLWPVDESTNHNNSQKSTDRPKKGPNDTSSLQQVYVGIVTQKLLSTTTVAAINDTWGRNVPKLEFLSTYNTLSVEGLSVVRLNGMEDTYSPEVKVYRMLKYIHDYHVNEYNWFMLVTDDVYIHVENLIQFLNKLDSSQMIYIGKSHKMITKDISKKDHCLRGPGVTVSRALLKKLIPFLEEYLEVSDKDAVTCNQVVERCISMKLGAQCTWIDEVYIVNTITVIIHVECGEYRVSSVSTWFVLLNSKHCYILTRPSV